GMGGRMLASEGFGDGRAAAARRGVGGAAQAPRPGQDCPVGGRVEATRDVPESLRAISAIPATAKPSASAWAPPKASPSQAVPTRLAASGIAIVNTPAWLAGTCRSPDSQSQVDATLAASA